MASPKALRKLRDALDKALRKERHSDALTLYAALESEEPDEPRWPHRHGDLLRRLKRDAQAIEAYARAVRRYAERGFVARAAAMAKVILSIDPLRVDVLASVDPEAARRLHRKKRKSYSQDDHGADARKSMHTATPLAVDDSADDDEVRFLDLDGDEDAIEIDLCEIELVPRAPSPRTTMEVDADELVFLDLDEEPERAPADHVAQLPSTPLFAEVPREVLLELVVKAELVDTPAGQPIVSEGEVSDALFVLVEGDAHVHVPGLEPIVLGEGDVIGETCLLDDVRRRADVLAGAGGVRALRIPKATLDALVPEHPILGDVLLELLARRLISNLLQTSPVFAGFDPHTRTEVAALFELRRAEEGTVLVSAGKRSDGLYCTLLGELLVGDHLRGPGAILGQRTLLSREPSTTDVTCMSDVLLLRLPAKRFNELAATYPPVLMYLSELSADEFE